MAKQTAVDYLAQQIKEFLGSIPHDPIHDYLFGISIKFAKDKERDQLISFAYAQINEMESELGDMIYKKVPEEIYQDHFEVKS